ncbi:MAG: Gfo/Idh/MocA family oxidoreductase [Bryobacterales bacterium]|nr:Gfo/Idh/MocA family oxidoreductase [Bryobacterales bacterium]
MTESNILRGGIAGCGYFSQFHLEAWGRMPDVEIVAAADPDLRRAQNAAPRAYATAEEMFERESLDFVDITTRPEWHLPLVDLAARHKVPVICQKPIAPSWESAVQIVEIAETAGIPCMVHENWRWQPWYREAARRIAGGAIGNPVAYQFRTRQKDGLGDTPYPNQPYFARMPRLLIYETLIHHIDTARFLFGEVASVLARTRRYNPMILGEDQAILTLTHESGLCGVVDGNRFADPIPAGPAMGDAVFEGEEAVLTILATGDIYRNREKVWENTVNTGYRGDSVLATQRHFIDCLRSGGPFESGGREYLKTVRVVEAAYESAGIGRAASG